MPHPVIKPKLIELTKIYMEGPFLHYIPKQKDKEDKEGEEEQEEKEEEE